MCKYRITGFVDDELYDYNCITILDEFGNSGSTAYVGKDVIYENYKNSNLVNEYDSDTSSEGVTALFVDGVAYRGENSPSPFVIVYGDRWKMDGEDEVPEGCWELLKTVDFKPNVLHIIEFDENKEVLKKWFALNGDTKNYTYFLHKDDL